ncbi:hypothetical protein TWF694_008055 [Orbilia ellipsospora]|uniref:Clr5 domain-containing protein n=1 Tax=Orbilia ellipsospora TaxID=2528407 RepID=A0AAV9XEZ5_9PEZI
MDAQIHVSPSKPRRRHTKLKGLEPHKHFILAQHNAGAKQKDILAALRTQRGLDLTLHAFKRVLDEWGISHKSLTQKRKLYIRNRIRERRSQEKYRHRVKFRRSKRELSEEEIDEIMSTSPTYFKGIYNHQIFVLTRVLPILEEQEDFTSNKDENTNLSDHTLGLDPFEAQEVSDPENGISNGNVADDIEQVYSCPATELQYFLSLDEEKSHQNTSEIHGEGVEELSELLSENLQKLCVLDAPPASSSIIQSTSQQETADKRLGPVDGSEGNQNGRDDTNYELQLYKESSEREVNYYVGDTQFNRYARDNEAKLQKFIHKSRKEAKEFIRSATELSEQTGVPFTKAIDLLERQLLESGTNRYLSYHAYTQILEGEDAETNMSDVEDASEILTAEEISAIVESFFWDIRQHCNEVSSQRSDIYHSILSTFIVNVPRLLKEYGSSHIFVAYSLYMTCRLVTHICVYPTNTIVWLQYYAINIFNKIGMSGHSINLRLFADTANEFTIQVSNGSPRWSRIKDCLANIRETIRLRVHNRFGKFGWQTILFYSILACKLMETQTERTLGEEIAYGIIYTIQRSGYNYSVGERYWFLDCIRSIAEMLQRCGKFQLAIWVIESSTWLGTKAKVVEDDAKMSAIKSSAYIGLSKYKSALEELFFSFHFYKHKYGLQYQRTTILIERMTYIMDQRGPQLYTSLDPVFQNIFAIFCRSKKTDFQIYQLLWKAWERGGINTRQLEQEYSNALALRDTNRSATPDLQDYMYFQSLETWIHAQNLSWN